MRINKRLNFLKDAMHVAYEKSSLKLSVLSNSFDSWCYRLRYSILDFEVEANKNQPRTAYYDTKCCIFETCEWALNKQLRNTHFNHHQWRPAELRMVVASSEWTCGFGIFSFSSLRERLSNSNSFGSHDQRQREGRWLTCRHTHTHTHTRTHTHVQHSILLSWKMLVCCALHP